MVYEFAVLRSLVPAPSRASQPHAGRRGWQAHPRHNPAMWSRAATRIGRGWLPHQWRLWPQHIITPVRRDASAPRTHRGVCRRAQATAPSLPPRTLGHRRAGRDQPRAYARPAGPRHGSSGCTRRRSSSGRIRACRKPSSSSSYLRSGDSVACTSALEGILR
jgi:hypothetical protein